MKHIWYSIIILTIHMALGENFDDERTPSGELHLIFEEQRPTAILEKCAHVSHEPTLTPMGVINPFLECVKGNSEMSNYVSIEDQQKLPTLDHSSIIQKEIQQTEESFDLNSADPYESSEQLREDEMKEFLDMIENDIHRQPAE